MERNSRFTDVKLHTQLDQVLSKHPYVKDLINFHHDVARKYRSQVGNLRNTYFEYENTKLTQKEKVAVLENMSKETLQTAVESVSAALLISDFLVSLVENINGLLINYLELVNDRQGKVQTFHDFILERRVGAEKLNPEEGRNNE